MKTMARTASQSVLAVTLIFLGWALGRAQTSAPAFGLAVDAPSGATTTKCVKGCELAWVERGMNVNNTALATFTYRCPVARRVGE